MALARVHADEPIHFWVVPCSSVVITTPSTDVGKELVGRTAEQHYIPISKDVTPMTAKDYLTPEA